MTDIMMRRGFHPDLQKKGLLKLVKYFCGDVVFLYKKIYSPTAVTRDYSIIII